MFSSWSSWTKQVLAPQADEERRTAELAKAGARTRPPVLWLLGKAQSGKSSIIEGLTGRTDVEIGQGYRACTRTSGLYDFPSSEECLIRFLDTRGLGEPHYDPAEDLAYSTAQAHGILVVMRACDPGQDIVRSVLAKARLENPQWPVVLVQTSLHEGYPSRTGHPDPYGFDTSPLAASVPTDLARALAYQQEDFAGLFDRHVAIDFTHPDDGFEPRLYGLDALWAALIDIVPVGFRAVLMAEPALSAGLRDLLFATAFPHIVSYALLSGAAAMVPLPVGNLTGVTIAQGKMVHSIASIYRQSLTHGLAALGPAVGMSFLPRMLARSFLASVPVAGTAAAGLWTAATTYSIGCALCWYFAEVARGYEPTTADVSRVYHEELARGQARFTKYFSSLAQNTSRHSQRPEQPHDAT